MLKPGTYKANVLSHAITETKKGDPQAVVEFSLMVDGYSSKIKWYGYFTDKTKAFTIKALICCGLKGNNPAGALEIGKEVSLVIENEADENGNEHSKVRWVNAPGGIAKVMPQDLAKAKLASLEGAVMAARQNMNLPVNDEEVPDWMRE